MQINFFPVQYCNLLSSLSLRVVPKCSCDLKGPKSIIYILGNFVNVTHSSHTFLVTVRPDDTNLKLACMKRAFSFSKKEDWKRINRIHSAICKETSLNCSLQDLFWQLNDSECQSKLRRKLELLICCWFLLLSTAILLLTVMYSF